jgi:hypothetical protein
MVRVSGISISCELPVYNNALKDCLFLFSDNSPCPPHPLAMTGWMTSWRNQVLALVVQEAIQMNDIDSTIIKG